MQKEWLQLIHAKGLPISAKRKLVTALGSAAAVLQAERATLSEILGKVRGVKSPSLRYPDEVERDLNALQRCGGDFIGFNHPDFPPLLNQINSAPLGLFVLGDKTLLCRAQLAIIGSRKPTPSGRRTTAQFAAELSEMGLAITSGLALGIDYSAHRGCLDAGGKTIAVTATGIDVVYPRANHALHHEIAENGVVVSEYPPGVPPKREHFPCRNRIISGLSLGALVVEAGIPSGSLITARLAGEQGREVFAVPGSIHVPVSRGCHYLLRQGAKLVETTTDISEEIGQFFVQPSVKTNAETTNQVHLDAHVNAHVDAHFDKIPETPKVIKTATLSKEAKRLYALIDYTPTSIDQLILQSGLTADEISYILTQLELAQLIAPCSGGYQRLPQPIPPET